MTTFNDRKKALFDSLCKAESQTLHGTRDVFLKPPDRTTREQRLKKFIKMKREVKQFRGRKSLYLRKAPKNPMRPTFLDDRNNSRKWTYYNMKDVPEVTDSTNAQAVAACMREIASSKSVRDTETENETSEKLRFKSSAERCVEPDDETTSAEKTQYVNSKRILPEYVIGKRINKNKPIQSKAKGIKGDRTNLRLEHLIDDDDDGSDKE